MPHAAKTFFSPQNSRSFWAETSSAAADLQAFGNRFGDFATNGWLGTQCTLPEPPPDPYVHPGTPEINIEQVLQKKCAWCHYGNNPSSGFPPAGLNFQQGKQDRARLTASRTIILADVVRKRMPLGCVGDYCLGDAEVNAISDWVDNGGRFTESQEEQDPLPGLQAVD